MNQEELKQRLIELIAKARASMRKESGLNCDLARNYYFAEFLVANGVTIRERARPLEEWGEDYGAVLWWKFPIEEPPYVGSPLDEKWTAYHTHWTPIVMPLPEPPERSDAK